VWEDRFLVYQGGPCRSTEDGTRREATHAGLTSATASTRPWPTAGRATFHPPPLPRLAEVGHLKTWTVGGHGNVLTRCAARLVRSVVTGVAVVVASQSLRPAGAPGPPRRRLSVSRRRPSRRDRLTYPCYHSDHSRRREDAAAMPEASARSLVDVIVVSTQWMRRAMPERTVEALQADAT